MDVIVYIILLLLLNINNFVDIVIFLNYENKIYIFSIEIFFEKLLVTDINILLLLINIMEKVEFNADPNNYKYGVPSYFTIKDHEIAKISPEWLSERRKCQATIDELQRQLQSLRNSKKFIPLPEETENTIRLRLSEEQVQQLQEEMNKKEMEYLKTNQKLLDDTLSRQQDYLTLQANFSQLQQLVKKKELEINDKVAQKSSEMEQTYLSKLKGAQGLIEGLEAQVAQKQLLLSEKISELQNLSKEKLEQSEFLKKQISDLNVAIQQDLGEKNNLVNQLKEKDGKISDLIQKLQSNSDAKNTTLQNEIQKLRKEAEDLRKKTEEQEKKVLDENNVVSQVIRQLKLIGTLNQCQLQSVQNRVLRSQISELEKRFLNNDKPK